MVLEDIKVVDLTQYVAGPYCTKLLADYGAEVIKVEKPGQGDGARTMEPYFHGDPHPEKSGLFLHLNTNKKSVTLNLKNKDGLKILKQLVRDADILVENFSPRVMSAMNLSYETLAGINPALVMTSISNFGQTGPYRDYKATELVIFGMSPHMITEGTPGREPLQFPGYKAQYLAGTYAAAATMAAYWGREHTGVGRHVDISIMECLCSPPEGAGRLMNYAFCGDDLERAGYRREGVYPFGYYQCKDGVVLIYGIVPAFWPRIVQWMGMPELLEDPRFQDPELRPLHHGDFDALLMPWLLERSREEVVRSAQELRIPVTMVYTLDEVIKDPHFNARQCFVDIDHPVTGKNTYPAIPFRLPNAPSRSQRPAPLLGQHNLEIYCDHLGYTKEQLCILRQTGTI